VGAVSGQSPVDREAALNRTAKRIAWWPLLKAVVPLVAVSTSLAVVYLVLGLASSQEQTLYGVPLLLAGLACAVVGLRRRLADLRSDDDPTTRGFGLLFLGWAATVVGMLLPWYVVG